MPRVPQTPAKPELPRGYDHVGQWVKSLREDAAKTAREIEDLTGYYGPEYRVTRAYLSLIEGGIRAPARVGTKKLEALRVAYRQNRDLWQRRTGVTIPRGAYLEPASFSPETETPTGSRLTPTQQQAREQAVQDFLAEVRPGMHTGVFDSGAGPSWMDEDPSTWIIEDPELFRKYPNLGTHRIVGSSIEPFASDGDVAYVVPDRELIASGRLVLVWLSDNGRVVKFLAHEDADGEHLLIQSNPDTEFRTPPGSALLGVVVGIRKMGVPKLPIKRIIEAITERMPYLLEEG